MGDGPDRDRHSPLERRLASALVTGEVADAYDDGTDSRDGCGHISAQLIRYVVRGKVVPLADIDPQGLWLEGAYIRDRIDLDDVSARLSCGSGTPLRRWPQPGAIVQQLAVTDHDAIDRIVQTDVGLDQVLAGLSTDDARLRDAVLAVVRAD